MSMRVSLINFTSFTVSVGASVTQTRPTKFSDRLLKRRVLARQYVFVETLAVMEVNMQTS